MLTLQRYDYSPKLANNQRKKLGGVDILRIFAGGMKALGFLTRDKERRKKWLRAFRIWQHRPYALKPLSEERHTCASCKTEFIGNFCPRCGQSAGVGRFSFKKAALLFLDVWGVGNRSMFRSIRDLVLRPGYMIRDYRMVSVLAWEKRTESSKTRKRWHRIPQRRQRHLSRSTWTTTVSIR